MISVFCFSNQPGEQSTETSSFISVLIAKIITIGRNLSYEKVEEVAVLINPFVRKLAHYTIYIIGGIIFMLHINTYNLKENKKLLYSTALGTIYAITDEIHQLFVEGRSGKASDIMIDTLGVITGVFVFLCLKHILHLIFNKKEK